MSLTMDDLLRLMERLRDPVHGCPWDVAQTFESVVPYTLEEAYEVLDAIQRQDLDDLKLELGDLLLQVVFHARIAEEQGAFSFGDVVAGIAAKLIRRHPHVFSADGEFLETRSPDMTSAEAERSWKTRKAEERRLSMSTMKAGDEDAALLGNVALALPALTRAEKISRHAAGYGFDWPDASSVIGKVREEVDEVAEALEAGNEAAVAEEIGDLLFSVANLARHAGVDPEAALRKGTAKFERRFHAMARHLSETGEGLTASDLAGMEAAWAAVKRSERQG